MEEDKNTKFQYLGITAILCLLAIGYISLGVLYYRYEDQRIKDDKFGEVSVIAKLKAESIQEWRRNRIVDVLRVTGPLVIRELVQFLHDPTDPSARSALQMQLSIDRMGSNYADAFFLDKKGNILLSDNPNPAPVDRATMKAIEVALKDHTAVLSDLFRDSKGLIYIDALAPISDNSGKFIAIVALRSKATDFLFPLIQEWPISSKTAETLLVRRDGDSILYLNELRHRSNTALQLRIPLTEAALPGVQAGLGNYGRIIGRDYRGIDVLAFTQPVPESPWSIVAKVDEDEILSEVTYRAWVIGIIFFLLILISAGLIRSVYRRSQEDERRKADEEKEKIIVELRQALSEIKALSGMLPICASCKKIRDDQGYWQQIESYISQHSQAEFSHGICPECAKKLYPGFIDRKK
jgi:hypothetical protein